MPQISSMTGAVVRKSSGRALPSTTCCLAFSTLPRRRERSPRSTDCQPNRSLGRAPTSSTMPTRFSRDIVKSKRRWRAVIRPNWYRSSRALTKGCFSSGSGARDVRKPRPNAPTAPKEVGSRRSINGVPSSRCTHRSHVRCEAWWQIRTWPATSDGSRIFSNDPDCGKSFAELDVQFVVLSDIGLPLDVDDRTLWQRCQSEGWVLLTDNRNEVDPTSLQATLDEAWAPGMLPVLTLADKQRFERDAEYRQRVASDIADVLFGLKHGEYRDRDRILSPVKWKMPGAPIGCRLRNRFVALEGQAALFGRATEVQSGWLVYRVRRPRKQAAAQ